MFRAALWYLEHWQSGNNSKITPSLWGLIKIVLKNCPQDANTINERATIVRESVLHQIYWLCLIQKIRQRIIDLFIIFCGKKHITEITILYGINLLQYESGPRINV